ncbi:unnamed protein product [Schistosoma rodhaini]|uniref:MHD domain-containing protein n=1 Tax=Schistosoma rodhaini TaxID=6188 RepID=A0AA85F519_9TREM|nr:unnamed protein product [Schistosoma rodhaini]
MSFKFNPIAFISRRSSKVRAKTRSESADQTSLSQNDSDNEFQSPVVRSRTRPSKKISSGQDPKSFPSSSSIRAQVLASLRRTRSPKRKVHQTSVRAISVPPSTLENDASTHIDSIVTSTAINDNCKVAGVVSSKYGKRQTKECESPAPLAQDDCFELTDMSDVESDPMHKSQAFQCPISDENKIQKTTIGTMDDNESNTPVGLQSQSLENIDIESNNLSSSIRDNHIDNKNEIDTNILSTYTYDSTDLQYESEGENSTENEYAIYTNNNNYFDDDKSVTKLAVEYEIDYPIIDHADYDDVLSFSNETPKQFSLSSDNEEEHDTEEQDDESTKSIQSSMNQSLTSIKQPEEEGENKENTQCDTRNVYQDEIDDRQSVRSNSEDDYYKYDDENQQSLVITIDREQNIQMHETSYGEVIQEQENTDQYESSNDELSQGPFSLTKLTAHNSEWENMRDNSNTYLTTPSIIITSASTESLMKINNENSLTPPMRPPPPPVPPPPSHSVSTPKRPSPPKELPPKPQHPQSTTTSQHDTSKKRRKKDKLFGLVDLGPLPSDPDPNFPFRSHFEKSVLPNPKKAIQRILRGETKAERRQRKEQQELNRLLKGPRDKTEQIIKLESSPHSKGWQEFQELTARIQSTVEESTSKIKALSSVYQTDDNQPTELKTDDIKPELELTENWANFDQIKTTSEENWANFDQSIATSNNHTESYSLDTDKNWANFQIEDLDKNNLGNWADFNQTPTTIDQIIDIKELEQPDNWAVFEQLQTSEQFVSSKPVESIGENWADFNTLQAVNQYPSHTSLGDENWANFELIAANNSLPFDSTGDIFNKNTDRTELKSTDNLFGNFENINNLQEDLFEQHCQEKTSEGEAHRRDHETVEENLFDSHYIKDTENPQNFNQLETDQKFLDFNNYNSQHPPNLSHLDTSEIVFELGVRGSVPEDITNNYNILKDTEDLLVRKKSIDTFGSHYTVVANNLIDPNNTEHSEQIVEFNQTKQTGTGEHLNESGHSAIEIKSDFSQTESSDNYFVVDRSGTTENLFGCDYPLPEVKLYSQTVIDTTQQKTTGKNNLSSSSKTIESKFDCNSSQIDIKTNSPESYFFLIDHQKLIQEKFLTTCSYFSKPHISQLNFKNMEADKLNRFNELDDNEVIQSNSIMDISEENYHDNYDIEHGNYEQNDDFDPEITADSSSDTSSYEDNEQHAVKENEDEIEGGEEEVEIGSKDHSSMIGEYDLGYHQHYDNTDYTDEEGMVFTTNAQNIKDNKEEINPFANDDFGDISIIATTTTIENKNKSIERKTSIDELKTIARPRVKPVRQETLSGNNPFRKRSDIDEPDMLNINPHITDTADISTDELTRIASGIKLISPQNKISLHSKIKDSFDSNTSESFNGEVEESKDELQNSEIIQTIENVNVNLDGFDPLQTIYPDSEDENSSHSNESRTLHITINQDQQQNTAMKSKSTVVSTDKDSELPITIQPPPQQSKSMNILDLNIESISNEENKMITEGDNHSTNETNANISPTTPPGWVDFFDDDDNNNNNNNDNNNNSNALSNVTAFKLDKDVVDKAFEIQLEQEDENNGSKPEPSYPEPPRPETPDPELDIPFHPFVNTEDTWRLWLRYPEKKTRVKQISKYTTDRYWREVAVRLIEEHGRKVIALHEIIENTDEISPEPYKTVRIEPYMQLSREKLQQYDKYGKLHVFKLNHVSYKELVGMRPEKFSIKNLQNLVTHKPKQNITLDHIPIYTEILKFGSLDQSRIRRLMPVFEDALMKIPSHKDTSLNYSREEVCCYVVDEYEGKLNVHGTILEQKARTRIFCTAFVNGGPHIVLGLNDKWRFGREVVRRSDILPVMHDEWINIQKPEFHSCVQMDEYEKDHMLQFYPLDGCRFELLRFRVSLRGNRELPMQVKVTYTIDGRRVSMRCDLLVPGYFSASKRSGAVPCEKVEINIPFPEEWIYHFRVEKHHKYGSVHSTLRKPGKIKGLERITQMAQSLLPPSMLEASIGVAKYEHLYKAIVWRIPRVPEKSEASFRPHLLTCNLVLAPHDTVPEWETLIPYCQIEYTMPSSTVSGATVRSISVEHTGNVEKFVKYLTKYKYTMDIDYQLGSRKEPVLKSLLDENTSSLYETSDEQTSSNRKYEQNASNNNISDNNNNHAMESEEYHRVNNVTTVISDEAQTNQTAPTEFGDLLGLGAEFDIPSDVRSEQSKSSNTDNIF